MTGEGGREGRREGGREHVTGEGGREERREDGALYLIPGSIPSPLQISSFNL